MKYTVLVGDIHETYEGTPEEIARLIELVGKKKNKAVIVNVPDINACEGADIECLAEHIHKTCLE